MRINCDPQTIVDSLEAIDNNEDKVEYIIQTLDSCGKKTPQKRTLKKKRALSGWNCYLKKCAATGMPFQECMKDSARKEKEYIPKKDYWSDLAKKGC